MRVLCMKPDAFFSQLKQYDFKLILFGHCAVYRHISVALEKTA
jgi:hypothetical protein